MVEIHMHEWEEWKRMLWYTQEGRFTGESRKCKKCPVVETRNVAVELRSAVLQPTISLYPGIFNEEGKLLLVRRSLDIKSSPGEWEPPGGGASALNASTAIDERIVAQELTRIVGERVGLKIVVQTMPSMYPAVLKGGGDWAFAILIGMTYVLPNIGEAKYVSPEELRQLADGPEGNRLVSGWGKRMCRLCLRLFASRDAPNREYAKQASKMLEEIQSH